MSNRRSFTIIGLGPRGISTLERLTAALSTDDSMSSNPMVLHLIDDAGPGGRIWEKEQPDIFRMNTFAHGMTLFAEPGSTVSSPVVEGPTIYEWIQLVAGNRTGIAAAKQRYFDAHPPSPELLERYGAEELSAYKPDSFLPRAVYGYYLRWVFDSLLARLPKWVTPVIHRARAVSIVSQGGSDLIELSDSSVIVSDATVAVTGWQAQTLSSSQRHVQQCVTEFPGLQWIAPDNPLEQDLSSIPAGELVFVRGLGMGFFDVLAATTIGRGGRFVDDPAARSGMRYIPSGKEPMFIASSRRGYPFLPQSDYGALPTPAPMHRLRRVIEELGGRSGHESIDYGTEVYPAVVRDAYQAFVDTLPDSSLRTDRATIHRAIDATEPTELPGVVAEDTTQNLDLDSWHRPLQATAGSAEELTGIVAENLAMDIAEAMKGADSPLRAALWSIGSARKPTQVLGAEGRYTAQSRPLFDRMVALGQMACSGPPVFRTQQLLALVDASLVRFLGESPSLSVSATSTGAKWRMTSPSTGQTEYLARVLVDAWVEKPTVLRPTRDAFVRRVFETGRARAFAAPEPTASLELCPETRRLIHPDGTRDERLHFVGIPAHAQYPDTTISPPVPGTDPWFIQETDKAARSALRALSKVGVR
ncbi:MULTISPECIES: FAD/NAD(P)-binding protein [unclassified Corynebacterium]|uniref:FAD/NAD(P)-binding protein n=1 Tax=unclassified Corynebacterium TaxID=2624378 RepID=UPI0021AA750A|nr:MULTISPECIES: FAD/NAD(P)-binding protein [unclassified Corynebacterium]MCT1452442.1 FAD/NAD(P)-binding protein [Corynebacterium sp. p3-SID1145]MCT1461344.1 FAD/NAD(P)-binding protein [Corynebacterium sp. p3-SID1140]WKK63718.1 FAD/NAD(P)-binding protein [Corynebacterium sp. P8-C1]